MKSFISCLCPTYKRPGLLANAVRLFELQDYPAHLCELVILDDAGLYLKASGIEGKNWRILSTSDRFEHLPSKYNTLAERSGGDILIPWEDDDIYLPNHLSSIAAAHTAKRQFFEPENVHSTYGQAEGEYITEKCGGRFHSSWAFTRELFTDVNGYTPCDRLSFDQELRQRMLRRVGMLQENSTGNPGRPRVNEHYTTIYTEKPTFIYRWGNGSYHGSGQGEENYKGFYKSLENLEVDPVPHFEPTLDQESILLFAKLVPDVKL